VDASSEIPLRRLLSERPALRSFIAMRVAGALASQMLNVAIGWYIYAATNNPMSLAYVGLALFLPNVILVLFAGHAADEYDRRKIIAVSLFVQAACLAAFAVWATGRPPSAAPVYVMLVIIGSARAFSVPATTAMLPRLVGAAEFPRAVAVASSAFQISAIVGPALGGLVYAVGGMAVFAIATALYVFALAQVRFLQIEHPVADGPERELTDKRVLAGIHYIRSNRLLLGLISLDLFAVLLGGVTALLPIYAKDILAVGPAGLGWLRCAPAIGAAMVGVSLAHRPIGRQAGKLMLGCVAGFGVATICFAVSSNFWLSLAALIAVGGFDMVSMVIRQVLVQTSTPDAMRGRVSAVNWVFIGASNELGEFESGVTAALFGTVPAAVLGGMGTLVVVALWAWIFPELRHADRLSD
jgi:MFS family permease